jgi:two-component system chemotaxis sensor kinase CheA
VDKDQLIKRLMITFRQELAEHVRELNRDLLALEKEVNEKERVHLLQTLFRTAHSLKGAARSVSLSLIESACHQLEEILAAARDGMILSSSGHFPLLFAAADAIEEAGMRLREHQDLSGSPLANLLPRLEAAVREISEQPQRTASLQEDVPGAGRQPTMPERVPHMAEAVEEPAACSATITVVAPTPHGEPTRVRRPDTSATPSDEFQSAPAPPSHAIDWGTVRVPAEKLDAFLARDGELLVARRRVESRAEEVSALREFVGRLIEEWRGVERSLQKWLDKGDRAPAESQARSEAPERGANGRLPQRVASVLGREGLNLRRLEKDLDRFAAAMSSDHRLLKQAADALDDELRRVRMIPFADACEGLERMVRDLARAGGKDVVLAIEGSAVELDRSVLEGLKDPLRHLVRNAVDHGVETPDERRLAGKPPQAHVRVAAVLRGARVEVGVADDGRGIDLESLRLALRRKGLAEPADEIELVRSLFLPGFSTSRLITDVSGRGVGLDVAKSRVEALHGTIDVSFVAGKGSTFTLSVPLTLTTLRVLLVEVSGRTFALAGTNVEKLVRIGPEELVSVAGREMLALGTAPLPVASLAETLGLRTRETARTGVKLPAVIVAAGEKRVAFVVDELLSEQEVVVKNLGARVRRLRQISGATLLPSGRIALVLNAPSLIRSAAGAAPAASLGRVARTNPVAKKRILVADDSVTTRTLEKSILETAGYEVAVAPDGDSAWQLLQERGADLLISDVEMPRMDGFALVEAVRGSERFQRLPVVLVTARGTEKDKARGAEVGADAYLVKSAFDQKNLLETIAQLL